MGKRIALIGLDGSGKSANIDKMKQDPDYSRYKFVWVRWKPTLLKPAYILMEKRVSGKNKSVDIRIQVDGKSGEKQAELNADYNAKSGLKEKIFGKPIIRRIWMFLALIDYFFQFYIKIMPFILTGKDIIFDRFYLDLFVDQGINFGYSPEKIFIGLENYKAMFSDKRLLTAFINTLIYGFVSTVLQNIIGLGRHCLSIPVLRATT